MGEHYARSWEGHQPVPEYLPMFHRYQCATCKNWVRYIERIGKWRHEP